jgi:hypothetical protein
MAHSFQDDPESLPIRCPTCGQKFRVKRELQGRMVECGGCEAQFRVNDETIVRTKRIYPGEHRDPRLESFARRPSDSVAAPHIATASYGREPSPATFEPPKPQRTLAGIIGVLLMIAVALLLGFGAHTGRALDGVPQVNRLILAGFAGLLGGILLIYGNPRGRKKAILVAVLGCAGLLAMPFVFTEASEPVVSQNGGATRAQETAGGGEASMKLAKSIGLEPLIQENRRLAEKGNAGWAVGLWLRELKESNKLIVRDHLIKATGASEDSNLYIRDGDDWLMVLAGVRRPIEEIAEIAGKLGRGGKATRIHPDLNLIEIEIDNSLFVESPVELLNDNTKPAFYDLNRRELNSIDVDRARRAVKRLIDAEPTIFRDDIVRRLAQMLADADPADANSIAQALNVWATPEQVYATAAAADCLRRLHAAGAPPPRELAAFLVKRREMSIAPVLDDVWAKDHTGWEQLYGELGPGIEPLILARLDTESMILRHSAMRLLARIGSEQSLPRIRSLRAGADTELKVLIDRAEAAIRQRGGKN